MNKTLRIFASDYKIYNYTHFTIKCVSELLHASHELAHGPLIICAFNYNEK